MSQMDNEHLKNYNLSIENEFHAVYIPHENNGLLLDNNTENYLHIYTNKIDALKVIKEHKTGRLKTFKSYFDAKEYAISGHEETYNCAKNSVNAGTPVIEEKPNNFKAPKSQDLICFKKLIESGDLNAVKDTIWANPRYLIGSGDTPAILQEGCRYNALHIAVKTGRADMCELILSTVGDTEFMQLFYGEEGNRSYVDRADIILDLYLNTPDKGLNETPLHFAVKFGFRDVVKVLVSYSQCIKTLTNKFNQAPANIICSRKGQENESLKKEIHMLLEEQFYVPVLRADDKTMQPTIGEPFSPTSPLNLNRDPISPCVKVRAFAGPMSKTQAIEFRRKWKTPPRRCNTPIKKDIQEINILNSSNENLTLRLQDTEKGLERIGRNLAEEYQVSWKEYWHFLNDFADFRCVDGLMKLEKYLEQRFVKQSYYYDKKTTNESSIDSQPEFVDELDKLCLKLQSISLLNKSDENDNDGNLLNLSGITNLWNDSQSKLDIKNNDGAEFFTPPSTPPLINSDSEDDMYSAEEGCTLFIEKDVPTRIDYAVYNAVSSPINVNKYPNIYRWRHEMQLVMKRERSQSPNVCTNTIRRRLLMTP
ncbi:PREDICTED: ankyrin repeat and LEM domain-containing protein 2 [Polistes canadensis]|uniref:ankyrin repeat and LEM domain-containing protein 2 n=1 Tax=Polistes canadensis TaxID=91411 RepID=UPI000718FED9|nr:PREDICTED: ankyrin repeat and LEM domain-containing protein 2 [Polistes canadensis]